MTVAEQARLLADAAAGVVLQPTEDGGMEIVTASTLDDPAGTRRHDHRARLPGAGAAAGRRAGLHRRLGDRSADDHACADRFGPSMMLPLQSGGRLIGTLALPRRRGGRPYTRGGAAAGHPVRLAGRARPGAGRRPAQPGAARGLRGP